MRITKIVEFDAGHRVPSHGGKCRNMHGHRYRLEVTFRGEVKPVRNRSDDGMVADFGDLKAMIVQHVAEPWDHAFLVYEGDTEVRELLSCLPQHKTVVLHMIPTAENLAQIALEVLETALKDRYSFGTFVVDRVRLYETPNSYADAEGTGR